MVSELLRANHYLKLFCSLFVVSLVLTGLHSAQAKSDSQPLQLAETKDKKKSDGEDDGDEEGC